MAHVGLRLPKRHSRDCGLVWRRVEAEISSVVSIAFQGSGNIQGLGFRGWGLGV